MKRKTRGLWIGAACALWTVGAQAVRADDAKPVSLVMAPKAGDSVRYKTTLKINVNGNDITVEQTRKHVVKEVKENKDVVLAIEEEGGKLEAGGNTTDIPAGTPTAVTVDKANKVVAFKPEKDDNPYLSATCQHLMSLIDRIILPDKPVKPGDSWTTEVDNPQVKGKKVTIKTTFVGDDKADGAPALKFKQTLEADTDAADAKLKAETTALLDPATGQLIEEEQTAKGLPGMMGPVDWKGTIKRQKKDSPAAK